MLQTGQADQHRIVFGVTASGLVLGAHSVVNEMAEAVTAARNAATWGELRSSPGGRVVLVHILELGSHADELDHLMRAVQRLRADLQDSADLQEAQYTVRNDDAVRTQLDDAGFDTPADLWQALHNLIRVVHGRGPIDSIVALPSHEQLAAVRQLLPSGQDETELVRWRNRLRLWLTLTQHMGADSDSGVGDDDPFDNEAHVPGWEEADWPHNLRAIVDEWVPHKILNDYGERVGGMTSGTWIEFDLRDRNDIAADLEQAGYTVERDDRLVATAQRMTPIHDVPDAVAAEELPPTSVGRMKPGDRGSVDGDCFAIDPDGTLWVRRSAHVFRRHGHYPLECTPTGLVVDMPADMALPRLVEGPWTRVAYVSVRRRCPK